MEVAKFVSKRLRIAEEQAEGGAGAVYLVVRQRLSDDEFVQVAYATPAISDLMLKAPRFAVPTRRGLLDLISRWCGGLGTLRPLRKPFTDLQLEPAIIRPFTAELVEYARQQDRPDAARLLQRALQ